MVGYLWVRESSMEVAFRHRLGSVGTSGCPTGISVATQQIAENARQFCVLKGSL